VADSGTVLSGAVGGVSKVEGVGGRTTSTCFTRDMISTIVENQYKPGRRHTMLKVAAGVDAFVKRVLHGPTDKALLRAWTCETRGRESARSRKAEVHSHNLTDSTTGVSFPNMRTVVIVVTGLSSGLLRLARDADFSLHQTSVSAPSLTGCKK
jgi:hypothetical protein